MKMISKIKNVLISAGIAIMTFPRKVFANTHNFMGDLEYGVHDPDPEPNNIAVAFVIILNILRVIVIPIVLIIGLIKYCKKSKNSIKMKIAKSILAILIAIGLIALITYIMTYIRENYYY